MLHLKILLTIFLWFIHTPLSADNDQLCYVVLVIHLPLTLGHKKIEGKEFFITDSLAYDQQSISEWNCALWCDDNSLQ